MMFYDLFVKGLLFDRKVYFGGGAPDVPAPKPIPRSPTRVEPEIALAKQNLRERMLRAQGRAASREAGPGFLETTKTKGLTDKLA